jgi:hypothetical protein
MKKIMILISLTFLIAQDPISLVGEISGIRLDSKAPELTWIYPSGGEYVDANEIITPQWSFIEDNPLENGLTLSLYNSENEILNEFNLNEVLEYSFVLPNINNTTAYFTLSLQDEFGYSAIIQSAEFYIGFLDPISITGEINGFTLDSKPPSVTVISPNGGESYSVDETLTVLWSANDEELENNAISILLSTDGGNNFDQLQGNIENTGTILIEIPDEISDNALIKIIAFDYYGNIGEDISDNFFELLPIEDIQFFGDLSSIYLDSKAPIVEWISPNEGGFLPAGEIIQAEWNTTDDSFNESPVSIDINNNGISVSTFSNQSASGIHDITLPEIISENISFKITATDNFGNSSIDESDNLFTLKVFGCTDVTANNYNELAEIDDNSCFYTTTLRIGSGNNLISLPGPLFDNSTQTFIEAIEEQCGNNIYFILGQGVGLFNTENGWTGNLNTLDNTSGYWINASSGCDFEFEINGYSDECLPYDLANGNNLVSYAGIDNATTIDALGGEVLSGLFNFILGQGLGLFNTYIGWSGNLNNLENNRGYWLNSNSANPSFVWGSDCESIEPVAREITENIIPQEYQFIQSINQAFYLINEIIVNGNQPDEDDIILAYHNDVLVGSAVYNEVMTVLPVMGRDMSEQTIGFLEDGEKPTLRLFRASGESISLNANLDGFRNLMVSEVGTVTGSTIVIPFEYALHPAYPNPFNPVTTITFSIPTVESLRVTTLQIYNINGRLIETLINGSIEPGLHTVEWDANGSPSGMYFVKMNSGDFSETQKLMLVK